VLVDVLDADVLACKEGAEVDLAPVVAPELPRLMASVKRQEKARITGHTGIHTGNGDYLKPVPTTRSTVNSSNRRRIGTYRSSLHPNRLVRSRPRQDYSFTGEILPRVNEAGGIRCMLACEVRKCMWLDNQLESPVIFTGPGRGNSAKLHSDKAGAKALNRSVQPIDAGDELVAHRAGQAAGVWSSIWEQLPYRLQDVLLILILLALGAWIRASFWVAAVWSDALPSNPKRSVEDVGSSRLIK